MTLYDGKIVSQPSSSPSTVLPSATSWVPDLCLGLSVNTYEQLVCIFGLCAPHIYVYVCAGMCVRVSVRLSPLGASAHQVSCAPAGPLGGSQDGGPRTLRASGEFSSPLDRAYRNFSPQPPLSAGRCSAARTC